ncbi:hypothetical protein [Streptomyces sp. NPDC007905]|uniref:hypothetical protein n=1 Tax=Streptomyces sp. NPDC007905 TaxID=3364788 RepID=UPI0036E85B36
MYDKPGDPYTRTLRESFAALIKGLPYEPQPFTPPADRSREGKAVPIVELTPEGGSRFVRIAWPEGKPPAEEGLPPS